VLYFLVELNPTLTIEKYIEARCKDPYSLEYDPTPAQYLENVLEYGYEATKVPKGYESTGASKAYLVCLAPVDEVFGDKALIVIVKNDNRYFGSGVSNLKDITLSSIFNTDDPVLLERVDFTGVVLPWFEVNQD